MKLNEQVDRIKKLMGVLNEQQNLRGTPNNELYDLKDVVNNGKVESKYGSLLFETIMSKTKIKFDSNLSDDSNLEEIIVSFVDSKSIVKYTPQVSSYMIYYSQVSIPANYTKLLDFIKPIEEELKSKNFYCKFEEFGTGYVRVKIGVIGEEPITVTNQAQVDYENKQNTANNKTETTTQNSNAPTNDVQNSNTTTNAQATTTQIQNSNTTTNAQATNTQNANVTTNTTTNVSQNQTTQPKGQEKIVTNFDRTYDYKMDAQGNFFFKGKPNTSASKTYPDWTPPKNETSLNAIKTKVFKQK